MSSPKGSRESASSRGFAELTLRCEHPPKASCYQLIGNLLRCFCAEFRAADLAYFCQYFHEKYFLSNEYKLILVCSRKMVKKSAVVIRANDLR